MSTAVSYTYAYPFDSAVVEGSRGPGIRLATSLEESSDDLFFDGYLRRPALVGKCLTILSTIVRTRFYQPADLPVWADPVVTSGGGMLRFEGFSSCCGAYARVDLFPDAFDVELRGKGTTNVDFNDAMRVALRRLNDTQTAQLQVGGDGLTLVRGDEQVVERKVKLPLRWIKGFSEVQAYQPRMTPHFELSPLEARDLFRSLPPASNSRRPIHIARTGQKLRLASRALRGSVQLQGVQRVRVLEPLIPFTTKLLIWCDEDSQTSGWDLHFEIGRFFALVSPEINRGFSGEGQMLTRLAGRSWQEALPSVAKSLNWQSRFVVGAIQKLLLRLDGPASSWDGLAAASSLSPLLRADRAWPPAAIYALWLAMFSRDNDARAVAIDALVEGLFDGRAHPEPLGEVLVEIAGYSWAKLNRLGEGLREAARISPWGSAVISRILDRLIASWSMLPRDAHHILALQLELLMAINGRLSEAAQTPLEALAGGSKTTQLARRLLALDGTSASMAYRSALLEGLDRRIARAENVQRHFGFSR